MPNRSRFSHVVIGFAMFLTVTLPFASGPDFGMSRMTASEGVPLQAKNLSAPASTGDDDCLPKYPPPPTVKIKVRVPANAEPGQGIEYRICVENCSTAEAHHVTVKNMLPTNAKFVKSDPPPSKMEPELTWNLGTVGGGATREIILVLQPTNTDDVKNCVRVQFEHGQCVTTRMSGAGKGDRPPIISVVPDVPKKDVNVPVFKIDVNGPKDQFSNLPAKYTITVANLGTARAVNAEARLFFATDKLTVVNASDKADKQGKLVEWKLGDIEPGASRTIDVTLRATEKGDYCFNVAATADGQFAKQVEVCTKFVGVSAMTMEMFDHNDPVFVGDKARYPIVIRNQGGEPLTNIVVRALIPPPLKLERANAKFTAKDPEAAGQWIEFLPLPKIDVNAEARYEIQVEALKIGVTRFHVEVRADQLTSQLPVIEQELTTVVDDREAIRPKVKELSRQR
ncbi:MAG: DUF11 domain-containing protein [Gemmataceae bacterium]|nr:DUF11 domain-containing protein [Gemmataceae bacterium]